MRHRKRRLGAAGDTWPRAAEPLLSLRRRGLVAPFEDAVPPPCRRRGESPAGRRLRPRRQPHLELRPLAARNPALAATLPPLHGEVGALLVAARAAHPSGRRLQSTTWGA